MKNIILILFSIFIANTNVIGQNSNNSGVGNITISIVMPSEHPELTMPDLSLLESKLLKILSTNGITGMENSSNFVVFPKYEIYKDEMLSAGIEPVNIIKAELFLFVKNTTDNKVYGSMSIKLQATGLSKKIAIRNTIASISSRDKAFNTFLVASKKNILNFYNQRCDIILAEAERYSKSSEYKKAIATIMAIPEESKTCYLKSREKALEYYTLHLNQTCSQTILEAQSEKAKKNYVAALELLGTIDPASACNSTANELIKKLEQKVTEEQKLELKRAEKERSQEVELEKARIAAMKEITTTYYENQPKVEYHYNTIIK